MNNYLIKLFVLSLFILLTEQQSSTSPTWIGNPYLETDKVQIIKDFSSISKTATVPIYFVETYPSIPKVAFGIVAYRGNDGLYDQDFIFQTQSVTQLAVTINVVVYGVTNIRILSMMYLAVHPLFQYHLNTFNDVDATYGGLTLNPINIYNNQVRTFINHINYTKLCTTISTNYNQFGIENLDKNKIAAYISGMYNYVNISNAADKVQPVKFDITTRPLNATFFQLKVQVQPKYQVDLLKLSFITMDIENIETSKQYTIVYNTDRYYFDKDYYIPLESSFFKEVFIGMLDFNTVTPSCTIDFVLEFQPSNSRIVVKKTSPHPSSSFANCGLYSARLVTFYMKTWFCPNPFYFFNLATDMCDDYCANYLYQNLTAKQCQPCPFGCYSCNPNFTTMCLSCNSADHRTLFNDTCICQTGYHQIDSSMNITVCEKCSTTVAYCTSCQYDVPTMSFFCASCQTGTYLSYDGNCILCPTSIPFCSLCHQSYQPPSLYYATCDKCLNGYYLQNNLCNACTLTGCLVCVSSVQCQICNTTDNYFLNGLMCEKCTLNECLVCSSLTQCAVCNYTNNFFVNISTELCEQCSLDECLLCASLDECFDCNLLNSYALNLTSKQCDYCDSSLNLFVNLTSQRCQPCTQQGCTICSDLFYCLVCNQSLNYFLNSSTDTCQLCALSNCLTCFDLQNCLICNQTNAFFLNSTSDNLCYQCDLEGCITCATLYTCSLCNITDNYGLLPNGTCNRCPFACTCDGYYLPRIVTPPLNVQHCSTVCGDGLKRQLQQCDDGNLNNFDGCSDHCVIQHLWTCSIASEPTCCTIQSNIIYLTIIDVKKVLRQNAFLVTVDLLPSIPFATQQKLEQSLIVTLTGVQATLDKFTVKGPRITLKFVYTQNVYGKQCTISMELDVAQDSNSSCIVEVNTNLTFYPSSSNNLPMMIFSKEDYDKMEQMENSADIVLIISYVLLILSAIPCKIVGIQLFGVLQIAYFSLAQMENLNILLYPFTKLSAANGYNPNFIDQEETLPNKIESIGYSALFLNNCGLMLAVLAAEMIIGLVLYLIARILEAAQLKTLSSVAKRLLKQFLLTLIMFNALNFAFGVGIHFTYADTSINQYWLNTFCALGCVLLPIAISIALISTQSSGFGEYKAKFKPQLMCQLYCVFSLIYRFVVGYYIAVKAQYSLSTLVVLSFSLLFIMYNFVNLPFNSTLHNYRANICHISQLTILFVGNFYESMKSQTPLEEKAYIYDPAYIYIEAIYASIAISFIAVFFELYLFVKSCLKPSPVNNSYKDVKVTSTTVPKNVNNLSNTNFLNTMNDQCMIDANQDGFDDNVNKLNKNKNDISFDQFNEKQRKRNLRNSKRQN